MIVTVDYGNRWRDVEVPDGATGAEIKAAAQVAFRENAMPHFVVLMGRNRNGSFTVIGDTDGRAVAGHVLHHRRGRQRLMRPW